MDQERPGGVTGHPKRRWSAGEERCESPGRLSVCLWGSGELVGVPYPRWEGGRGVPRRIPRCYLWDPSLVSPCSSASISVWPHRYSPLLKRRRWSTIFLCSTGAIVIWAKKNHGLRRCHLLWLVLELLEYSLPLPNPPSPEVKVLTYPRTVCGAPECCGGGGECKVRRAGGESGCRESCGIFRLECIWPSGKCWIIQLPDKQSLSLVSELTQSAMEEEILKGGRKWFTSGTVLETIGRNADLTRHKGQNSCLDDHPSFYTPNYLLVNWFHFNTVVPIFHSAVSITSGQTRIWTENHDLLNRKFQK